MSLKGSRRFKMAEQVKISVFYVGSSLIAPLKKAETDISRRFPFALEVAAYNCGGPLPADDWDRIERDLLGSDLVFIIHVTDQENADRIIAALDAANAELVEVISAMNDDRLMDVIGDMRDRSLGSGVSRYVTLHGLVQHHVYHAGQISLLKKVLTP